MPKRRASLPQKTSLAPANIISDESGDLAAGSGRPEVALAWPGPYAVGISSLGFHLVRQEARERGGARVERFFREPGWQRTLESGRSPADFEILAFSVSFEPDYCGVLDTLHGAGLNLLASQRNGAGPLVLAGGVAVTANRHPIYPFVDVLVHGEGEATIAPLMEICRRREGFRSNKHTRARLLEELSQLPGVEVTAGALRAAGAEVPEGFPSDQLDARIAAEENITPDFFPSLSPILPARARDLLTAEIASRIVTARAELGRRILVEIARGCPHTCAFCWTGHNCRDFTPQPAECILEACDRARRITHCDSVGLVSPAVGAHPEIADICDGFLSRGMCVSYSSLRAEEAAAHLLTTLARSGQRGVTFAPEAGDERLRRRLGKNLSNAGFFDAIERAQKAGLEDLKLYFMTGLPEETEETADQIIAFTDAARKILLAHGRERGRLGEVAVNLGIYVPKPNTPLARRSTPPFSVVRKRAAHLTRALAALPNVRVAPASADQAAAQRLLSMGGFESSGFLYAFWKSGAKWRSLVRKAIQEQEAQKT